MSEEIFLPCHLLRIPNEILCYIFTKLNPLELIKCREVCLHWKYIVDGLFNYSSLWEKFCRNDFEETYKKARVISLNRISWYGLYKSLSLWPKLNQASELQDEFAFATSRDDQIIEISTLSNGILCVHTITGVTYYNLYSLQPISPKINGIYFKYYENNHYVFTLEYSLELTIKRKYNRTAYSKATETYTNVKTFLVTDFDLFYLTVDEALYKIDLTDANLNNVLMKRYNEVGFNLGYKNKVLYLLTAERNIYYWQDKKEYQCSLVGSTNLLNDLSKRNLLENMNWFFYKQWMVNETIPEGPLRNISTMTVYNNMIFVGTQQGVLLIYSKGDELKIYNEQPIKQYNFMERQDCPVLSDNCCIIQIDVIETGNGHILLVCMPKKISVIQFNHKFVSLL